ncbi:unnamed protein product, partial [Oppiella nova]
APVSVWGTDDQAQKCRDTCSRVRCAPANKSECDKVHGEFLDYAPSLCRCCSQCKVTLGVGADMKHSDTYLC